MRPRVSPCVALTLVAALLLAGGVARAQVSTVRLGILPIADVLPVFLGVERGIYRSHGLDFKLEMMPGGGPTLSALAGGSLDIGLVNVISLMAAKERGLDFVILAADNYSNNDTTLLVRADSGIRRARDLEGKTVAVNVLNGGGWLFAREWVKRDGGDPAKVKFMEVPFHQIGPPLLNRQIDAAMGVEPFGTILLGNPEVRNLGFFFDIVDPGGIIAVFVATRPWVEKNPDVARRFVAAVRESMTYLNAHLDEGRRILPKYTRLTAEMATKITLPRFSAEVNVANMQAIADMMMAHGLLKTRVRVEEMLYRPASGS